MIPEVEEAQCRHAGKKDQDDFLKRVASPSNNVPRRWLLAASEEEDEQKCNHRHVPRPYDGVEVNSQGADRDEDGDMHPDGAEKGCTAKASGEKSHTHGALEERRRECQMVG